MQSKGSSAIDFCHPQSSRLAELGGRGMSFNICRGTLGSLAMYTAIRNASSRDSRPNRPPSCPLSERLCCKTLIETNHER